MWCVYFLACVLLPICVPVPETAVIMWGTRQIGSPGAFFWGVIGSVLGLVIMYSLSSLIAQRISKGRKEKRQLAWLKHLTGRYRVWILGVLLIVPLVSDEVLCAGSALLKIPLPQFLKIGIIAKVISIDCLFGFSWRLVRSEAMADDRCGASVHAPCLSGSAALLQKRRSKAIMKEFILVVDDDKDIRRLLGIYLGNEGYRYLACENAAQALHFLEHYQVDLILMDVMMPEIDGISACLRIRERSKMPVIFMSAKTEDIDIIKGLTAGGDDYVTKPFKPIELLARVRAQIRRYKQYNETEKPTHTLQTEDLTVDIERHQVWVSGREVRLTRKEYDILEYMLRNKGQVLTMAQIYEAVWHEEFFCSENAVMMHIANLRDKLNWDNVHSDFIKTCWGRGYQI